MINIDQLKKETDEIKKGLEELKNNVSISESERKSRADTLKSQAETTKQKIQTEIDALKDKTDDESKKNKEEAETLLLSLDEIMNLYSSVISDLPTQSQPEQESKGLFSKTKDWVKNQWSDVWNKEKWEDERGKNLLRTVGFAATGVGAVALAYEGIKRLFSKNYKEEIPGYDSMTKQEQKKAKKELKKQKRKEKKEKRENRPWWQKFLIGTAVTGGAVVGGVQLYKHRNRVMSWIKEKLGLSLNFSEAMTKVEAEVKNGMIKDDNFGKMNAHFEGITFAEANSELLSYGEVTKIDKKTKKIEGLDVEFASYEELIHAANIVNFAKRKLKGRGATDKPFVVSGGDLAFNCSANGEKDFLSASDSNVWTRILGLGGGAAGGILGGYFAGVKGALTGAVAGGGTGYLAGALIDDKSTLGDTCRTICRGTNLQLFVNYLNGQQNFEGKSIWENAGEQRIDPNETPINEVIDNGKEGLDWAGVLEEIENAYGEDQTGRRNLHVERDESKPEEYKICSYNQELNLIVEGGPTKKGEKIDYTKIKKIRIGKYDKYDSRGDGLDIEFPHTKDGLKEAIRVANLTNMIVEDWKGRGGEAYPFYWGAYSTPAALDMDTEGWRGKTILSRDAAKKNSTLFNDLKKGSNGGVGHVVGVGDHQKDMHNQALEDKSEDSQYIKFLHQIGKGRFWKSK